MNTYIRKIRATLGTRNIMQEKHLYIILQISVTQWAATQLWSLSSTYFVTQQSNYTILSKFLLKHVRMPGQLQYPSNVYYFLFLPDLLTWSNSHLEQCVTLSSMCHLWTLHSDMWGSTVDDFKVTENNIILLKTEVDKPALAELMQ